MFSAILVCSVMFQEYCVKFLSIILRHASVECVKARDASALYSSSAWRISPMITSTAVEEKCVYFVLN